MDRLLGATNLRSRTSQRLTHVTNSWQGGNQGGNYPRVTSGVDAFRHYTAGAVQAVANVRNPLNPLVFTTPL
eukprot:638263-Pyramimonas_sp.AAC.3